MNPQFLLGTLRDVGARHERDCAAADAMLANLIVYLRAALPHLRSTRSTLDNELRDGPP